MQKKYLGVCQTSMMELFCENNTAQKVSVFGDFLVRIFLHSGSFFLLHISPYLVQMWENTDQKNSEYRHFLRSVING